MKRISWQRRLVLQGQMRNFMAYNAISMLEAQTCSLEMLNMKTMEIELVHVTVVKQLAPSVLFDIYNYNEDALPNLNKRCQAVQKAHELWQTLNPTKDAAV